MGKRPTTHNAFIEQVRTALTHYHNPVWLGQHSPLASIYFLSQHLRGDEGQDSSTRGKALQRLIDAAATRLWGDQPLPADRDALFQACEIGYDKRKSKSRHYRYTLLELCYFRRYVPPDMYPRDRGDCQVFLEVGRNPFYEHLNKTIAQLSEIILELVQPTFRLESPLPQRALVGRDEALARCLERLHAGAVVAISGVSGIGKTRLGQAVCAAWHVGDVFWLTFRPKTNDSLNSTLFSLAHFLHGATNGNSLLWQQIVADKGNSQQQSVWLGLLRSDLKTLEKTPPLICFDDVDLLRSPYLVDSAEQHQALLTLIESLIAERTPILLIGQQIPLTVETHLSPNPLTEQQTDRLLASCDLTAQQTKQLWAVTAGNPRMLTLCAALYESGESVDAIVERFPRYPAVQPLLDRLWARLKKAKRHLMAALCVYRSPAPTDLWHDQQPAVHHLTTFGLIEHDQHGGMALTPTVRHLIYSNLARDLRDSYHAQAGSVRAQRGNYTAAAYHFYRAGDYATAIDVWYRHADLEMARGQATAARAVFDDVPTANLQPQQQAHLKSIRNRLALLLGDARRVLEDGALAVEDDAHGGDEVSAEISFQQAEAHELLGDLDAAAASYSEAATTTARLLRKNAQIAHKKVWLRLRNRQYDEAQQEASTAKCYAEFALGNVCHHRGEYDGATTHFQNALTLANMLDDVELIPKIHRRLSNVAGHRGQIDVARHHAEEAMHYFHKIGDVLRMEWMRADLAGMHLQVKDYEGVIDSAEIALRFFEKIQNVEAISATLCNLAEAHMELGNFAQALTLAQRVVQLEEPYYQPYAHYTLGLIQQRSQQFSEAVSVLEQGIAHATNDKFIRAYLQAALGHTHLLQGDDIAAKAHLTEAINAATRMGLERESVEWTQLLQASQNSQQPPQK